MRPRAWDGETRVLVRRPDERRDVEFGRDAIDVPFTVELVREEARVAIVSNGLGLFDVR